MRALCAGSGYTPGLLGSQNLPCVRLAWAGRPPRFSVPDPQQISGSAALRKQKEVNTNQFQCKCQAAPALNASGSECQGEPRPRPALWLRLVEGTGLGCTSLPLLG